MTFCDIEFAELSIRRQCVTFCAQMIIKMQIDHSQQLVRSTVSQVTPFPFFNMPKAMKAMKAMKKAKKAAAAPAPAMKAMKAMK